MSETPRYKLTLAPAGASNITAAYNPSMQLTDVLLDTVVESMALDTPPVTTGADVGKCWVPNATATGAWAGHEDELAICTGATLWTFADLPNGKIVYDKATSKHHRYDGAAFHMIGFIEVGTPASASAAGTQWQVKMDGSYIYVCTAPNAWKRVALTTW